MSLLDLPLDAAAAAVLSISLKGSLLLVLALGVALWLRRGAAAHRHAVWVTALAALLVLPVAGVLLPGWHVPLAVSQAEVPAAWAPFPPVHVGEWAEAEPLLLEEVAEAPAAVAAEVPGTPWAVGRAAVASASEVAVMHAQRIAATVLGHAWQLVGLLWVLGMGWLALRWGGALVGAARIVGEAEPLEGGGWEALALQAAREQGVQGPVRLLRSDYLAVPVAWTLYDPAVVLPADAEDWSVERRRVVLAHEMAHVARRDGLTQLLAQAAVLVHWFNPLAWLAYHRILEEREQACDDRVLMRGARPSAYAQHLVELARRYRQESLAVLALAPMARPTGLEARVRAILDPAPRRARARRGDLVVTAAVALALALPLAAFQPVPPPPPAPPAPPPVAHIVPTPPLPPVPPPPVHIHHYHVTDWSWSGTIREGGRLEVYGINGNVSAERAAGARVEAEAERRLSQPRRGSIDDVQIVVREHAGGAVICAVYPGQQGCEPGRGPSGSVRDAHVSVNFTLRVPDGVAFTANTTNGNVRAEGLGGPLALRTTNGNVSGETRRGDVEAHTTNGNVRARAAGLVRAGTTNGNIEARFGRADWSGTLRLATTNGNVTASLPADLHADVRARAGNGSVRTSLDLATRRVGYTGAEAEGRVGRGGRTLELAVQNGNVRILREGDRASGAVHARPHAAVVHAAPSPEAVKALSQASAEAALAAVEAVDWAGIGSVVEEAMLHAAEATAAIDWEEIRAEVNAGLAEAREELRAARLDHRQTLIELRQEHALSDEERVRIEREVEHALRETERALRDAERALREKDREAAPAPRP